MKYENSKQENYKNISCPACSSANLIKRGFRKTKNRGLVQRYSCKDCGKRFVLDNGFFRMRNSPQKITLCLDLFYRGVSTRKVQEHLQAFYPHNSSNVSIYSWVLKYARMISSFTNKLKLQIGNEVQVDEIEYHRRKSHKSKGFCLKADIKHYFEEVNHEVLISIIKRKIVDEKIIWLIRRILANLPEGKLGGGGEQRHETNLV